MNVRNLTAILISACFIYLISILGSSCAQILNPTGGPRDTLAPVLKNADPPNGTINFKEKKITLTYDEYIHLDRVQENLLVQPTQKIIPNVDWKLKTVTIKIRDTLEPNTTYRFDMGNSIQDIDENNPVKNYSYIFSTGPYIDSLTFSGNVQLAQTGKVDTTLLIFLYKDLDDSAVLKHKPRYVTRVNNKGNFQFYNLPPGVYNVFALKDESGQKIYNNKDELFAFADSTIHVTDTTGSIKLFAYAEEITKPKSSTAINAKASDKKLKFNTSLESGKQDLLSPLRVEFNNPLKGFDSLKIELTDTLFNPYKSALASLDSTHKKLIIKNNWLENTDYLLIIPKDFATDTLGTALVKADTIRFKTKKESEYGSIKINFKNLGKFKNPVLQFVSNNEVVNSFPLSSAQWSIKLITPGDYELRVLDDRNKNGIWDPGSYQLKLQPEKVYSITQKLNIRNNWDNERDIEL